MNRAFQVVSTPTLAGVLRVIPAKGRKILIEGIYSFQTAREVADRLASHGIRKRERTVMVWLKAVREWLGIPPHYPCLRDESYRLLVNECVRRNGKPTLGELEAGWVPRPPAPEPNLPNR